MSPEKQIEFVKAWKSSSSYADVITKTGLTKWQVQRTADAFRKKGVQLPHMGKGGGGSNGDAMTRKSKVAVDADALNALLGIDDEAEEA